MFVRLYLTYQDPSADFNRGLLMNIGFKEASSEGRYSCYIFHDVDLLPENDNNLYICDGMPKHMAVAVDKFEYK